MKGYKGFDKDLRCRDMRYEVGKEYALKGNPVVCNNGFHFCKTLLAVNDYYRLNESRVCEVEALGDIAKEGGKYCTNRIKILRELSRDEIITLANIGCENAGIGNSGNRNSGDGTSGNRNSWDGNSGNRNSGDWNSGNGNSGNGNSGNWNSGDQNSGNWNSGNFCSCNNSAGVFMSKRISWEAFNRALSENEFNSLVNSEGYEICKRFSLVKYRVRTATGKYGDFRYMDYKKSWAVFWNSLTVKERLAVRRMPFFDAEVFFEITGVRV
jgi:hypothetical protein